MSAPQAKRPKLVEAPEIAGFSGTTGPVLLARARKAQRGVLVNMWASWCGSCKKELPMLAEIQHAYAEHGLGLVLVTVDQKDALPKARELLDTTGVKAEAYYLAGPVGAFKRSVNPRWKGAIPATFLIDNQGELRFFWNGPVLANEISDIVQRFLAGEDIHGELDVATKPIAQ